MAAYLPSPGEAVAAAIQQTTEAREAAGAAACQVCHPKIFRTWKSSHHGRTSQPLASPPGGADLAIGSSWMQVYLRKDASGLHRLVEECFDVEERSWRDVDDVLDAIRGPLLNAEAGAHTARPRHRRSFEVDCSGCHVSGARIRADVEHGAIVGDWRAASIDCEACHGPARDHVDAWKRMDAGVPLPDLARLERVDPRAASAICARCHGGSGVGSQFTALDAEHWVARPRVGPREGQGVFSHGAPSGQVYQADAFLRSACHLEGGLSCTDCHGWHQDELRHTEYADAICARCHTEQASREHTHHAVDGEGGRCISCHMPRLSTGLLAHQRDHRISSPLPAAPGAPDACTACHQDRDKAWASGWSATWWGPPSERTLDAARGVELARDGDLERARPLLEAAASHREPFFRWAAAVWQDDPSSLIGESLIESRLLVLELAPAGPAGEELLHAGLNDASPVVRANAFVALARRGRAPIEPPLADLELAARLSRSRAGLRVVLARAYIARKRVAEAIDLLEETVVFGKRAPDAWLVLAGAYVLAEREPAAAAAVLRWRQIVEPFAHLRALLQKVSRSNDPALERALLTAVAQHAPDAELRSWARGRMEAGG